MPNELLPKTAPPVPQGKRPVMNVREAWAIYDTLIISPTWYGTEAQNRGWFANFVAFAQQEQHQFFIQRTEATAGLAYCNKQTADSMDFGFELFTVGCAFIAPGVRTLSEAGDGVDPVDQLNSQTAHWWETVFPRHCALQLKVQQDIIMELPSMAASPGYGPSGAGASFAHDQCGREEPQGGVNADYLPVLNMSVTQGVPTLKNRWSLGTKPIGIPRTGTIEAVITVSEPARIFLQQLAIQPHYFFGGNDGYTPGEYNKFPARFMIQVSLLGRRLVQQRANYFA